MASESTAAEGGDVGSAVSTSVGPLVGERLRGLRQGRHMTLKTVADRAGVSESYVSQLERGRVGTTLKSLQGIAEALGIQVGDIFDIADAGTARVVRRESRAAVSIGSLSKHRITPGGAHHVEVLAGTFEPGGTAGDEPYTHGDSEEVFVVISGTVEAVIGEDRWILETGDSLFYRSSVPHTFHEAGAARAEVLWIISPPSY